MIQLDQVSKTFRTDGREITALKDVSLTIAKGEFVAIVGPSGSGKSTLLQIIGCLDEPSSGSYQLDSIAVPTLDDASLSRLRNERIGFVFQGFNLVARTTAVENVELPMCYSPDRPSRDRAMAMLDRVGLADRAGHYPTQLSGGEQQRVAIARALILSPSIVIADEPTGNLDAASGGQILDQLLELHRVGLTVILVTHDPAIAARAQRQISLADGRVVRDTGIAVQPISTRSVP